MDALRKWIVSVALGSFAAGAVMGHTVSEAVATGPGVPATEQAWASELAATYGLDARQEHRLRLVLQHAREEEFSILMSAEASQLPPPLLSRVLAARNRTEQRIRALLDDEQRARYDRDSRPLGSSAGAGSGGTNR